MSKENSSSSGISTIGLLGVVFVVLKLTEVIDWSWWWVTFPFWGGVIIAILVVLVVFLTTLIPSLKKRNKLNKKLETIKSKPRSKFAERL